MEVLFKIQSIDSFTQVLEDVLNNLYDSNPISMNNIVDISYNYIKAEIKKIILDTNLNMNEVSELISAKHNDGEKVRIFIAHLEKRKSELLNLALVHYNCGFGETLNTFDWKLKLVCGTSELKTLSYPLLQLALYTVSVYHKPVVRLHDVNKDMLLRLIGTIEDQVGNKSND